MADQVMRRSSVNSSLLTDSATDLPRKLNFESKTPHLKVLDHRTFSINWTSKGWCSPKLQYQSNDTNIGVGYWSGVAWSRLWFTVIHKCEYKRNLHVNKFLFFLTASTSWNPVRSKMFLFPWPLKWRTLNLSYEN